MNWSADLTTDAARQYRLYLELSQNDEIKARIFRRDDGELVLVLYEAEQIEFPLKWLCALAGRAEQDL